jgi:hypothetical protein
MDMQALATDTTVARFNAKQDHLGRDFGFGDTVGALEITKGALDPRTAFIKHRIKKIPDLDFGRR